MMAAESEDENFQGIRMSFVYILFKFLNVYH